MNAPDAIAPLLACAAFAVGTTVGWLVTAVLSPFLLNWRLTAPTRALLLAQARILPLISAAWLVPIQILAFVRYEAGGDESVGLLLALAAASGIALAAHAVYSAASTWRATIRAIVVWQATATPLIVSHWARTAWAIRPAFPIVAVAGIFRPQLFVARQVVDACTPEELAAIAAHEAAHVAARDNLVRLLFRLTPGVLLAQPLAHTLEAAWSASAEEAADQAASRVALPLDLASALTKVARLASGPAPVVAVSTLIGGGDLQTRVRRLLLARAAPSRPHPVVWMPTLTLLVTAVLLEITPLSARVHEAFELLVRQGR